MTRWMECGCWFVVMLCVACWMTQLAKADEGSLLTVESAVMAMDYDANDSRLILATQHELQWIDLRTHQVVRRIQPRMNRVHCFYALPQQERIWIGGGTPGEVGQVSIWSLQGEELQHHALQPDMVQKILVLNNESWIAPGWDSVIPVGKVDSFPKTERTYEQHSGPILDAVAIQREGWVITCGVDQTIQVWNPQQAKRILTMDQHTGRVLALSLRPSNATESIPWLASISDEDRTLRLWQPTRGRLVRFLKLPVAPIDVAWTLDGERVACIRKDYRLQVIDPVSLKSEEISVPQDVGTPQAIVALPDQQWAVGGTKGVWFSKQKESR
ncbi:MAG: WD40 repeat domain-containing protein [Pirellulales bacterium]